MLYEAGLALSKIIKEDLLDYSRSKYKHRIGLLIWSQHSDQINIICMETYIGIFNSYGGEQYRGQIMTLNTGCVSSLVLKMLMSNKSSIYRRFSRISREMISSLNTWTGSQYDVIGLISK